MLRVSGGSAKNKKLKAPDIPDFRAVQEVAKLAIFSMLGEKVTGSICLDLFAGSGNLGIEALSRGAEWCDFVDEDRRATKTIDENVRACGFEEKSAIYDMNAIKFVAETPQMYDIIFADPFYKDIAQRYLLQNLEYVLSDDGVVFFMHGKELEIEKLIAGTGLILHSQRKYSNEHISILKKAVATNVDKE